MAMSVSVTEQAVGTVKKIEFAWTSAADGTATGTTAGVYDGQILAVTTIPDAVAAPTDDYDIELIDSGSHDVLLGAAANRDTADTESVTSSLGAVAHSPLTLSISAAGDTKKGVMAVWIR